MVLITDAHSRKLRRKEDRKKRKQNHGFHPTTVENKPVEEVTPKEDAPARKKLKKSSPKEGLKLTKEKKKDPKKKDSYAGLSSDLAETLRRDDVEIAELEAKLGLGKRNKKGKVKLNKEYSKLEGYGDDFGDFLDDLDDMVVRIAHPGDGDNRAEESDESDSNDREVDAKMDKKSKKKASKNSDDACASMNPDLVAAMGREDDEIAELEAKLGLGKKNKRSKDKLNKEYAKLEGYGDDFGDFLDDLDGVVQRVAKDDNSKYYESKLSQQDSDDESMDNDSEQESDSEEEVPMKDPFEQLDEDDSVLDELDAFEQEKGSNDSEGDVDLDELDALEKEQGSSDSEGDVADDDDLEDVEGSEQPAKADSGSDEEDKAVSDEDAEEARDMKNDSEASGDDDSGSDESDDDKPVPDHDIADTYKPSEGEDIYGNKLDAEGSDGKKPTKYVPPHLRKAQAENDPDREERLRVIRRALNSALNRLSEDTLVSVAQSVAQLYPAHPTQMVHEMIWTNTKNACISPPMLMTGLIPVYVACVVGVHCQTGDTVQLGEYLLEMTVTELWKDIEALRSAKGDGGMEEDALNEHKSKPVCNLMLVLCYLYNYNIVHCSFMYDMIRNLIENFSEIDIECLLLLLSHCGRSLRSDDPLALKEIVLLVSKKKAQDTKMGSSSRAEYMISAIMDLKNNRRSKQDTVYTEKAAKLRKVLGRIKSTAAASNKAKTSSESSLRISLQDILNADTKGRWWKVGASWVGNQYRFTEGEDGEETPETKIGKKESRGKESEHDEKLLRLASKLRMNTDRKRAIFCIIMGGTDCEDAFEKLCRSSFLQNRTERDTVRVLMECCGNEKSFNKFYGHLASRICEFQPQCKFSFQLAYWDMYKQFDTMDTRKAANLAKLLFHLVAIDQALKPLTAIKTIDMSDDEVDETALVFLTIFLSSIFDHFDDPLQVHAMFASHHTKKGDTDETEEEEAEEGNQAGLLVFLLETLKASPKNKKGSKFRKNFKAAVKALDTDGLENMF
jgi:nucleolar MIF4G domain-containing protein 1